MTIGDVFDAILGAAFIVAYGHAAFAAARLWARRDDA